MQRAGKEAAAAGTAGYARPVRTTLLSLLATAGALYLGVLALLWSGQEALLFQPAPLPANHRFQQDADVHELRVPVDGAVLSMLHLRLPQPKGVVFYLHGNAGHIGDWFTDLRFYREANFDLVMPDYRGFGKSTGRIVHGDQLHADMFAAWAHVAQNYQGRRVVLYGVSMGTGLVADLAARLTAQGRVPDLTFLVSPYSSMRELAGEKYPWVPTALLRYPLETAGRLGEAGGAVLVAHGDADPLIPVAHARRLQERVPRARLLVVPGVDHDGINMHPRTRQALREALQQL
jgi:pimeloyl-ACP methyl ester carboxylesterase